MNTRRQAVAWRVRSLLVCLATLVGGPLAALDPTKALSQYSRSHWHVDDGLPHGTVGAIAQTGDGYLWLGTRAGLARFDGDRFTVFNSRGSHELPSDVINDLVVDRRDGALWVATGGGVVRRAGEVFEVWTDADGLPPGRVLSLAPRAEGGVWLATYGGVIATLDTEGIATWIYEGGRPIFSLSADLAGNLWAAELGHGVHRLDGGDTLTFTAADGLSDVLVWEVLQDRRGDVWMGSFNALHRVEGGGVEVVARRVMGGDEQAPQRTTNILPKGVQTLLEDRDGNLWIGTHAGGLVRRLAADGVLEYVSIGSINDIAALFEDRDGNLWIGTTGDGLFRLRDGIVSPLGGPEGFPAGVVTSVWEAPDGALWLASPIDGLLRHDRSQLPSSGPIPQPTRILSRSLGREGGQVVQRIFTVLGDHQGTLWVGYLGGGLLGLPGAAEGGRVNGLTLRYTKENGLSDNSVFALYEGANPGLWIGTNNGVSHLREGQLETITPEDGLAGGRVRALESSTNGALWVGTTDGLSRVENGAVTLTWGPAEGLDGGAIALHEDSKGSLWIGTVGSGLYRLGNNTLSVLGPRQGLPANEITSILEDDVGRLWLGSRSGIVQVERDLLVEVAEGRAQQLTALRYGVADGMRTTEGHSGPQPTAWRGRDGSLWFGTLQGIAEIDPDRLGSGPAPPPVVLEGVEIDGEPWPLSKAADLRPGAHLVNIRFTALDFRSPERLELRYRLEGVDPDWVSAGQARSASYTNLAPGGYRFWVTARNGSGQWNPVPASFDLHIAPHLWERRWAQLFALVSALCVALVYLRGLKNRLARERDTSARLREQATALEVRDAEIMRFIYAISHDVRNPLVTLQTFLGLIERHHRKGDHAAVTRDLTRIRQASETLGRLMYDLVELSRVGREDSVFQTLDLIEVIEEARDRTLLKAEQQPIAIEASPDLPEIRGERTRLRELFEVLLDNALRFQGDTPDPWVAVRARPEGDGVLCEVEDNGIGISPRYQRKIFGLFERLDPSTPGTGMGLALAERIVKLHGGQIWVESDGEGHGSTFYVRLPRDPATASSEDLA